MKQFTEQEKQYICSEYLKTYNIQLLAKEMNVSAARIRTVFYKRIS